MRIAYHWLQDYVKTSQTPEQLADRLRITSCEVEAIERWGDRFKGLKIGKVVSVKKHPGADRLRLAQVTVGSKEYHIVCGAPNLAEGQTVVVALPGTVLQPNDKETFTIQETIIRGEKSEGMLCAASEIGLPLPSEGILVLDDSLVSGTDAAKALQLDDTVLDLEITPNRPDLLSYQGIAREIATLEKKSLLELPIASVEEDPSKEGIITSIEDLHLCSRYSVIALEGITVEPSPLWMQMRLLLSGIRPINNVVDVTNYVLLELGQPLHAFDRDKLGDTLSVRSAKKGEKLAALDGTERLLEEGDAVIVDGKNLPVALGGIMGGSSTEIHPGTTRIVLESATFDGAHIRRTSRRLGLRSEASGRFEKGLDPEQTITALKRAIYLLQQISTAKVVGNLVDAYPKSRPERNRISVTFDRIQQLLGVHISAAESKTILHHLGFQIPVLTKSSIEVIPPSWRRDVSIPEDIVEELIRIWGFERLPTTLPSGVVKAPVRNPFFAAKQTLRRTLAADGLQETISLSFTSAQAIEKIGDKADQCIQVEYPLSAETSHLIPSHLIHFLDNVAGPNIQETDICLFEIGHVFRKPQEEVERLSFLLRNPDERINPYRQARSLVRHILSVINRLDETYTIRAATQPLAGLEASIALEIVVQNQVIGQLGLVSESVVSAFKIRSARQLLFASFDLDILLNLPTRHRSYVAASDFPSIERDITLVVAKSLPLGNITNLLTTEAGKGIRVNSYIKDIYTGKPLANEQKSVTIHFVYNHQERTLEDTEVQTHQTQLISRFRKELQATITE